MTPAAADPVRAQVEDVLHRAVNRAVAVPCDVACRTGAAARSSLTQLGSVAAATFTLARSMVELMAGNPFGVDQQPARPADFEPNAERPDQGQTSSPAAASDHGVRQAAAELLPLEGYESLAASQVVDRLGRLGPRELERVREFERTHRGRRTILGKIDQLLDA
jgi:hypothetical protein